MPSANAALWLATGVTAVAGAAAFVYFRRTRIKRDGNQLNQAIKTGDQVQSAGVQRTQLPGIRSLAHVRKMVFVVNRPLLSNKQTLFISVSTACLRYYRAIMANPAYYDSHVKPWTRTGQMKVVLKANSGEELESILARCRQEGVEAMMLTMADFPSTWGEVKKWKKPNNSSWVSNVDPSTPVVLCVLAPSAQLDQITGHLKLL